MTSRGRRTSEVILKYVTDRQSLQQTKAGADLVDQRLQAVGQTGGEVSSSMKRTGDAIRNAFAMTASSGGLLKFARASKGAKDAADDLRTSLGRVETQARDVNEEFDRLSRDVGLAGDIQSNLGALGGIAGFAGAGGAGTAISGVGEVFALIEELPRLKTAFSGLPKVLSSAAGALGPFGVALAGAAAGALIAANQIKGIFADIERETKARVEAIATTEEQAATLTREEAQARLRAIEEERQQAINIRDEALQGRRDAFETAKETAGVFGDAGGRVLFGLTTVFSGTEAASSELIDTQKGRIAALDAEREGLEELLATERLNRRTRIAEIEREAEFQREINNLRNQSSDALQQVADSRRADNDIIQQQIQQLEELGEDTSDLSRQYERNERIINVITSTLLGSAQAREREAESAKEAQEAAEERARFEEQRRDEIANATQRFNQDIANIEEHSFEERAAIQERFNDRIVQIAETAADAADEALEDLQETRANLTRDLGRDEAQASIEAQQERLDAQIEFQRDEARAFRNHQRELQRIREDAQERELELIAGRDFRALFFSRRQTTRALQRAGEQFSAERQERQIAADEQLQDLQRQFQRERQERLAKFQQDLADAQAQFQRERQLAEEKRQEQLAIAQQEREEALREAHQRRDELLRIRRQEVQQELQIASQGAQQRLAIEAQTQQALLAQAQQLMSGFRSQNFGFGFNQFNQNQSQTVNVNTNTVDSNAVAGSVISLTRSLFSQI